jgi:hypothetical protein
MLLSKSFSTFDEKREQSIFLIFGGTNYSSSMPNGIPHHAFFNFKLRPVCSYIRKTFLQKLKKNYFKKGKRIPLGVSLGHCGDNQLDGICNIRFLLMQYLIIIIFSMQPLCYMSFNCFSSSYSVKWAV